MIPQEAILTRRRIMGVLLRDARLRAKKSVEEVAQALACDPNLIAEAEEGETGLTLPQVECLAHFLQVPLAHLLGQGDLLEEEDPDLAPYRDIMVLRRKIIGVMLRQTRLEAGRALKEVAAVLGYSPEHLARVELGEEEIDLIELQVLAEALGIPFENLISEDLTPSSDAADQGQHDLESLAHLPPQVREFVANSINAPYLQVAMNLSQMPVETLRQIATGLFEITY